MLNPLRNKLSIAGIALLHDSYLNQSLTDTSNVTFNSVTCGNLTASGTIYLTGTVTEVETQHFIVSDSFITLNENDLNQTALNTGGLQLVRGASLPNFMFVYSESDQTARIGIAGLTQPIATREEIPTDGFMAVWNNTQKRFLTTNIFTGPFTFQGVLSLDSVHFGTTTVTGDNFGNFSITNNGSITLQSQSVIVPIGTSIQFQSNSGTISFIENNGSVKLIGSLIVDNSLSFGGSVSIYSSNSANDLNFTGERVFLNPSVLVNIGTVPIIHGGMATFQVTNGNIYQLSSTGNINIVPGSSNRVYIQRLSLGSVGNEIDLFNSNSGDLTIDTPGNITLNPVNYVMINPSKKLAFGNVNNFITLSNSGDLSMDSTGGIILQAASQVYIPGTVNLNFGSHSSVFENGNGNFNIVSNSSDIYLTPGSSRSIIIPANNTLIFGSTERVSSDGTNLVIESSGQINFVTPISVNVPTLTFGDIYHRIYKDNANNLNLISNHNINLSATEYVQFSANIKVGSTKIYQDIDSALTLSSDIASSFVKSAQDFFIASSTQSSSNGAGSLKTLGGIYAAKNLVILGDSYVNTLNVGNGVVNISDSGFPIQIQNSSLTNGTAIGMTAQWDPNSSFTIGRGSNSLGGGRAMVFTLPSYNVYGTGSRPSFIFENFTGGTPYMKISDDSVSILGNLSGQGDGLFGGDVQGVTFSNSVGTFSVTGSLVNIVNSGLNVSSFFGVYDQNQNQILQVDNTGLSCYLNSSFSNLQANNVTVLGNFTVETDSVFNGNVNLSGNRLYNVAMPIFDNDITNKLYVDSVAIGRTDKQAVKAASVDYNDLSVPIFNLDNVSISPGDRIILKDQVNGIENGIYVLDINNIAQRSPDFSVGMNVSGSSVFTITGLVNGSVGFVVINAINIVGTNPILWTPFSGAATINVTTGLVKIGNNLSANLDNFSISVNNQNQIQILDSFFGSGFSFDINGHVITSNDQSNVTQLGTVTSGIWEASTVNVSHGGTGLNSIGSGNILYGDGSNVIGNTSNFVYDPTINFLGIGTNSPIANVSVFNQPGVYQGTYIRVTDNDSLISQSSGLIIENISMSSSLTLNNSGTLVLSQDSVSQNSKVAISTQQIQRIIVDSDGNVIIGTSVPNTGSLLSVSGETFSTGLKIQNYVNFFDVANLNIDILNQSGLLLTVSSFRITGNTTINGNALIGNLGISSDIAETTILSNNLPLKIRASQNQLGLCAIGFIGGLVIPNALQIGGNETDTTTGFTFKNVNGDMILQPGVSGQTFIIKSNVSLTNNFNIYNSLAVMDKFTGNVESGTFSLTASGNANNFLIGGSGNNIICEFSNNSNSGGLTYDPTDNSTFSGGIFSVNQNTGSNFGNQVKLQKELRFSALNSLEGTFGTFGNGFYFLGTLNVGNYLITVDLNWEIQISFNGNNFSIIRLVIYNRGNINFQIYDNSLNSFFLFFKVINGPINIKIVQSPNELGFNLFEGSSGSPSGTFSGYNGSWNLDFDLISNNPVGITETANLNVSDTCSITNGTFSGVTQINGPLNVSGESFFSSDLFTWFSTVTNSNLSSFNTGVQENSLTVYAKDNAAATIYLEKVSAEASISVLPSSDPVYPNGLIISQNTSDPTSQIILQTQGIPQVTIDSLGNVVILSTTDSISTESASLIVSGSEIVQKNFQVNGFANVGSLELASSVSGQPNINISNNLGNIDIDNNRIINISNPISPNDAVNLQTLQSFLQGLSPKESVIAASTGNNIEISSSLTVLDNVTLDVNQRVLLKDQTDSNENGIYIVQILGLVRSQDFLIGAQVAGCYFFVESGVQNGGSGWVVSNELAHSTVGVNGIIFLQFSGAGEIIAGSGLSKSGNELSINTDGSTIEMFQGSLRVASGVAGQGLTGGSGVSLSVTDISHLSNLGTITSGTWNGDLIGVSFGGTGVSSVSAGKVVYSNGVTLTEGSLYFDEVNVRLGINTNFPVSGLTIVDRDINLIQTLGSPSSTLFTDSTNNFMYGLRNDTRNLIFSSGVGNNKNSLTDIALFDNTGIFTCLFGIASPFINLNSVTVTEDSFFKNVNGPLTFDFFSNDNSGTVLNLFGGLGTYGNDADSEFMSIGYKNGDFLLSVDRTGLGNQRNLSLQTGNNTNQLILKADSSISMSGSVLIQGTTESISGNSGSLIVSGGAGINGNLYTGNLFVTNTSGQSASFANSVSIAAGLSIGSSYNLFVDLNSNLNLSGIVSGSPANIYLYNYNSSNVSDTTMKFFGLGKDILLNSEWLSIGFEASQIYYALRTESIGAGQNKPLVLSAVTHSDQMTLFSDGRISIDGDLETSTLTVTSTTDAVSSNFSGCAMISGGLSVGKSLYAGTLLNSPLIQSTGILQISNSSSVDKVHVSYTSSGNLHFYNNFNLALNLHVANSQGPTSLNQEKIFFGFKDINTLSLNSTSSGTGLTRDLAIETRFFPNQIKLSASTGQISFNGNIFISDSTEATDLTSGSLITSGGASITRNLFVGKCVNIGSSGQYNSLLQLNSYDNSWRFSSLNGLGNTLTFSPVNYESIFQIVNSTGTSILLEIDTIQNEVSSNASFIISNTSTRALTLQTGFNSDSFVFDTQNHLFDVINGRIVNLSLPQGPLDAVNKVYVDNFIAGLSVKLSVNLASTVNVNVLNVVSTIDSVTVSPGMRVLLKNQTNSVENGIYVINNSNYLTRSSDLSNGSHSAGCFTYVEQGSSNTAKGFVCITVSPADIIGQNQVHWTQFIGGLAFNFGQGFTDNGGVYTISLDINSGLSFNGNSLRIDPTIAGSCLDYTSGVLSLIQSDIVTVGDVTSGTWNADTVTVLHGGTGNTSFNSGSMIYSNGSILQGTSGLQWNSITSTLGINCSPNDTTNGLTIKDKDINLQNGNILYSDESTGFYNWRLRTDIGQSRKETLPVANSTQIKISFNGNAGIIITEPGLTDYITTTSGSIWTPLTLDGVTHALGEACISQDGTFITIAGEDDFLYVSQNSGLTWLQKVTDFIRLWEWTDMSLTGQFQMASSLSDGVFVSQDSGTTWTYSLPTDVTDVGFVHVTKTGSTMFAGYTPGDLYISTDNGSTFNASSVRSGNWFDIAESPGSNVIVLYEYPGSLFVSNNLGITFTEISITQNWCSVAISNSGAVIIAAAENGLLYISTDFGVTFSITLDGTSRLWSFVKISSDATAIFAGGHSLSVYLSNDLGVSWTTISDPLFVKSAAMSPIMNTLFYPEYQGKVHSYSTVSNTNLVISTGSSSSKTALNDSVVFTDSGLTGFGFSNSNSGEISATVDINGNLHVVDNLELDIPLDTSSGGTGNNGTLSGLLIGKPGTGSFISTGLVTANSVPIGNSDNSGEVVLQSGSTLRTSLGLSIGVDIQSYSDILTNLGSLTPSSGYFITGNGSNFVTSSISNVITALNLGSIAFRNTIDNSYFSGVKLSVSNGGTGNGTFTSSAIPFYNGSIFTDSPIYTSNSCVSIGTSTNLTNVKLLVYGNDLCIQQNSFGPLSLLFANSTNNYNWRIRSDTDFIISGGTSNSDKTQLTDQFKISSSGSVSIFNTTDTVSSSTGCLILSGGLGVSAGITADGLINFTNVTDSTSINSASVNLSGGLSVTKAVTIGGTVNFLQTSDASNGSNGSVIFSGGLSINKGIYSLGTITICRGGSSGTRATGMTISADTSTFTNGSTISDSNRHLSLINTVSNGMVTFSMRNITASYGWDIISDPVSNSLIWQTNSGSVSKKMSLNAVTGSLTLFGSNDSISGTSSSLTVIGGIYCEKSIQALNTIECQVECGVTNTASTAKFALYTDTGTGASLFLNNSFTNSDGDFNELTLRNDNGDLRLQNNSSLGITVKTNNVIIDNTADSSSSSSGSLVVNGGLGVEKSVNIGSDLMVSGTFTASSITSLVTLSTPAGDMSNITSLSVYSANLMTINTMNTLTCNFQVTPTSSASVTQFTFSLPNKTSNLSSRMDVNCSVQCFYDNVNLYQVPSIVVTGVAGSLKVIVKFTSASATIHYIQIQTIYNSL